MDRLPPDHFFYLCDAKEHTDAKQDQYLCLLENCPQSEEEAKGLLRTVHHRRERANRKQRKHVLPLLFDPPAAQTEDEGGVLTDALSSLSDTERMLIEDHVLEEISLRDIAKKTGVPRETIRRRYKQAKEALIGKIPPR